MKKYRVIGYPIGHSMSPFIHKELFNLRGVAADYDKLEIAPENLGAAFADTLCKLSGFNVTIPHKVEIIKYLDRLDESAAEYGAVNVVAFENGEYVGYNTDAYGFLEGARLYGIKLSGKVLIYGFGGAARTIITECVKAGCEVTIGTAPDFLEQAKKTVGELASSLGSEIKVILGEDIKERYNLFVNATPVGMYPKIDALPIDEEKIDLFDAVYDIVYNPEETMLLRAAKEKGKLCCGGLSMLVAQAAKAHEYFYGATFTQAEVLEVIKAAAAKQEKLFKKNNIILCGFMGAGKTTLAEGLAEHFGMEFIDTDKQIEKRENRSIADIFEKEGEAYFRTKETELVKELCTKENLVISLGGGLAANRENHPFLKVAGKVVLLDCGIEETLKRISGDKERPLTKNGKEDIVKRYNLRKPVYEEIADIILDSSFSPEKTLKVAVAAINELF